MIINSKSSIAGNANFFAAKKIDGCPPWLDATNVAES